MDNDVSAAPEPDESYNPWTVVNLVFDHLAARGLHPVLGATGHPGEPAAELLRCLGIRPDPQGDQRISAQKAAKLAELREAFFGEP
ncbi:hypothetical protein AB0E69_25925 [Kribbella sp. NPDC026611]|uniref:hypothetical protein n=1 Tax=Kribbella sp. NPDC026611 TaxID=3154911 RepID=UPI0033F8E896